MKHRDSTKELSLKVSPDILSLEPYRPGKPIAEAKREFNLKQVFKLASNENPLGPSPRVKEAIEAALVDLHRYPDASAFEMLNCYSQHINVDRIRITFGNGSNELIDLLIRLYCESGDAILTSKAAFVAYRIGAQAARVRCIETPLSPEGRFDLSAMKSALEKDSRIKLIFIANPNNPTGTLLSGDELRDFLKFTSRFDLKVVLDEAYTEYVTSPQYESGLKLMNDFPQVVVLRTMSKAYALAALRVGFVIADEQTIDLLNRIRNPFNVNSLAQVATVAALQDQAHMRKGLEHTWRSMDLWRENLKSMGLTFFDSQANFILCDTKCDSAKVDLACLKQGFIFRPVRNYGLMTHLRISMGTEAENHGGIEALRKTLREISAQTGAP